LIKGSPAGRRAFIDQAVVLVNPEALELYKTFKQVLSCRNALLERYNANIDFLELAIWTQKLLEISLKIQELRQNVMLKVEQVVNELLDQFFSGIYHISIDYDSKWLVLGDNQDVSLYKIDQLIYQERAIKRSLFGAHLDDLIFQIRGQKARIFASRGQQKLICLLCKVSLILIERGDRVKPMLLIDDFISDFDTVRLSNLIDFLVSRQNQIIITAPFFDSGIKILVEKAHPDVLSINS
jgi:DNA replication and repair protein RecF